MTWDCEYGNYKDMNNETHWADNFFPKKPARESARKKFDEAMREILQEIADDNGFSYEQTDKWDWDDWYYFREAMDL